jgi:hypothetical protein
MTNTKALITLCKDRRSIVSESLNYFKVRFKMEQKAHKKALYNKCISICNNKISSIDIFVQAVRKQTIEEEN